MGYRFRQLIRSTHSNIVGSLKRQATRQSASSLTPATATGTFHAEKTSPTTCTVPMNPLHPKGCSFVVSSLRISFGDVPVVPNLEVVPLSLLPQGCVDISKYKITLLGARPLRLPPAYVLERVALRYLCIVHNSTLNQHAGHFGCGVFCCNHPLRHSFPMALSDSEHSDDDEHDMDRSRQPLPRD